MSIVGTITVPPPEPRVYWMPPVGSLAGAPAPRIHRMLWRFLRAVDDVMYRIEMRLTGQGSQWMACIACGAPPFIRKPHSEYTPDGAHFGDLCELCVSELGVREWPCENCSDMTVDEWVAFIHREVLSHDGGFPITLAPGESVEVRL